MAQIGRQVEIKIHDCKIFTLKYQTRNINICFQQGEQTNLTAFGLTAKLARLHASSVTGSIYMCDALPATESQMTPKINAASMSDNCLPNA